MGVYRSMVRDIAIHRVPNTKVQEPEITDQSREQRPDTVPSRPKILNDNWRQEKAN